MSLSNATWQAFSRGSNVQETWGLWLFDDLGNELHLSDRDGSIGADALHGFVSDWGDVRRSIDLAKFVAKVDNVSITLHNGVYHGEKLIETLGPHAARKWINREARLYSWLNGNASSKMQIYTGRLRNVSWTADEITLDIEQAQPWDFIRIPDTMTDVVGLYVPIIAGSGTPTNSTVASPSYCQNMALFPLPSARRANGEIWCPALEISNSPRAHFFEQSSNAFVPVLDDDGYADAITDMGDYYYCRANWLLTHAYRVKPTYADVEPSWTGDVFTNQSNAYDEPNSDETSTYATGTATADFYTGSLFSGECEMGIAIPFSALPFSGIAVEIVYRSTTGGSIAQDILRIYSGTGDDQEIEDSVGIISDDTVRTATLNISGSAPPSYCMISAEVYGSYLSWLQVKIYDVRILLTAQISTSADALAQASAREGLETLYFSGIGLSTSWVSAHVQYIHELHRELLYRYTGLTSTPEGWAALDAVRGNDGFGDGYLVRWWLHEPEELQKILEKAQFEGAFIFAWSMTTAGTGRYLFVKDFYSAGDVAATISEGDDTLGLSYSHTPFDELVTKQVVNYQRHPVENRYVAQLTHTNSTARTAWNIQTLENVETVDLDMLTSDQYAQQWAEIRDNIFGDLKRIVSCDIVTPRYFILEIGDIVKFEDDNRYYMIVSERRTQGRLSITAREVYA